MTPSPNGIPFWNARIELLRIEEQAFNALFAPSQAIKSSERDCTCAMELLGHLDHWHDTYHSEVLEQYEGVDSSEPLRLETRGGLDIVVKYYFLRTILLRADQETRKHPDLVRGTAHDLIRVITNGWQTIPGLGHYIGLTS